MDKFYDNIEFIGEGSQSKVYKAKDKKTGEFVAIKTLHMYNFDDDILGFQSLQTNELFIQKFKEEIKILSHLVHKNIIKYINYLDIDNIPYLIIEFCETSLRIQIKNKVDINFINFGIDVLQGLHYLHTNDIIHADLKPENILFHSGIYKICDFGLSKLESSVIATPDYSAPELCEKNITNKIDIWSFALIIVEILNGSLPERTSLVDTTNIIKIINEKCKFSLLKPKLLKCLDVDKTKRPNTITLLHYYSKTQKNNENSGINAENNINNDSEVNFKSYNAGNFFKGVINFFSNQ